MEITSKKNDVHSLLKLAIKAIHRGCRVLSMIVLSGMVLLVGSGCVGPHEKLDLADFDEFLFEQRSALGFCPKTGSILSAEISRTAESTFVVNFRLVEAFEYRDGDCPEGWVELDYECLSISTIPQRVLTEDELVLIDEVFRSVRVEKSAYFMCAGMFIDPCVINRYTWDEYTVGNFICGSKRVAVDQDDALQTLLEQLVSN